MRRNRSTTFNHDHFISIHNPMEYSYNVRWQSDLVNIKESVLPLCDKHHHTNKGILQKVEEIENLRNSAVWQNWDLWDKNVVKWLSSHLVGHTEKFDPVSRDNGGLAARVVEDSEVAEAVTAVEKHHRLLGAVFQSRHQRCGENPADSLYQSYENSQT